MTQAFAELLIDCEEDRTLRAVLLGMLREAERFGSFPQGRISRGSPFHADGASSFYAQDVQDSEYIVSGKRNTMPCGHAVSVSRRIALIPEESTNTSSSMSRRDLPRGIDGRGRVQSIHPQRSCPTRGLLQDRHLSGAPRRRRPP
jgi:hypothetical protein